MPVEHPSTKAARCLLERYRRKKSEWQHAALTAFQPCTVVVAHQYLAKCKGTTVSVGRVNLERLEEALHHLESKCGFQMGFLQRQLMHVAKLILVKRIFGSQLEQERHYLRIRLGIRRLCEQAAVILPRRAGKTVTQTILAALVAVTQPDGNVCCFQIGSRQSKSWLAKVINVLRYFRGTKWDWKLVHIDSKERIVITNCCGTTVSITSYPGPRDAGATNFRGEGDKLMLLMYDEFYFCHPSVWPTTLPLAKLGAAILMISSMSKNHDDAVRRMIYSKVPQTGEDLFLLLNWLRACPECQEKGTANTCTHIEHRPQHFEPRSGMGRMKALMAPHGDVLSPPPFPLSC